MKVSKLFVAFLLKFGKKNKFVPIFGKGAFSLTDDFFPIDAIISILSSTFAQLEKSRHFHAFYE